MDGTGEYSVMPRQSHNTVGVAALPSAKCQVTTGRLSAHGPLTKSFALVFMLVYPAATD